jgi:hypothetical protein
MAAQIIDLRIDVRKREKPLGNASEKQVLLQIFR